MALLCFMPLFGYPTLLAEKAEFLTMGLEWSLILILSVKAKGPNLCFTLELALDYRLSLKSKISSI